MPRLDVDIADLENRIRRGLGSPVDANTVAKLLAELLPLFTIRDTAPTQTEVVEDLRRFGKLSRDVLGNPMLNDGRVIEAGLYAAALEVLWLEEQAKNAPVPAPAPVAPVVVVDPARPV